MTTPIDPKPIPQPLPLLTLLPVAQGAGVSVVAPAASAKLEVAERGLKRLRALGLAPRLGHHAFQKGPLYFAGTEAQRLEDLHRAFADKDTSVVACLRGGYGSNYLLDGLDLELIRKHPKPFFGYSDLTGIQLHLLDRLGLPAFHGPMVATDFSRDKGVHLPSFQLALAGVPYSVGPEEGLRILRSGRISSPVRGILYGGCLSILVSLLGTPYEPRTEGKLLFLEDTGAKPYQIDRMLWQLRQAGKLEGARGIVFGEMLDCSSPGASPNLLDEVILRVLGDFDRPIVIGLRSGHVSHGNVTLTLGVEAELRTTDEAELRLLQPAVGRLGIRG
ncbi:MAG: LD-carboxypeptidase [Terracidiphilus sp.]|jgi:muramoyltetrapeptide carboxypeptidase